MKRLLLAVVAVAWLAAPPTSGAAKPTLGDIEDEVMCPTCGVALSLSESRQADRQRALIQRLIDQGRSKAEIKERLVREFGPEVLASPPRRGFSLAAYLVPLSALVLALASGVFAVRRRARRPRDPPAPPDGDGFAELVDEDIVRLGR